MHVCAFLIAIFGLTTPAFATTLWSGSLVEASSTNATQKISVNYPAHGVGKICGVEFKTKTMILNQRVWSSLLSGLTISAEYDGTPTGIAPNITLEEGSRLFFIFDDNRASYASLVVTTKTAEPVLTYIQRTLGNQQERAVFVAKECVLP